MRGKKNLKSLCFDIDGVICTLTRNNNYKKSKPIKKNIVFINNLYDQGYKITLFTARYMGRYKNNRVKAEKKIKKFTIEQLDKWKLKYDQVFFGKPSYDIMVDDKSLFFKKNWIKEMENSLKNEKK